MNSFKNNVYLGLLLLSLTHLKAMERPNNPLKTNSVETNVVHQNTQNHTLSTYFWRAVKASKERLNVYLTLPLQKSQEHLLVPSVEGEFEDQLNDVMRRMDGLLNQFTYYKDFTVHCKVHVSDLKYKKIIEEKFKEKHIRNYPIVAKDMNTCLVAFQVSVIPIHNNKVSKKAAL